MSSSAPLKTQCIEMAFLTAIQGTGDGRFLIGTNLSSPFCDR